MIDQVFTHFAPFGKGLATMATLIVAIGVQNVFVLRQGIKDEAVFLVASICFLCDVSLVVLGTAGLGALFAASPLINMMIAFGGAAFLSFYGVRSLHAAKHAKGLDLGTAQKTKRAAIARTTLAVSLLNPHALLDTVVLVGGLAGRYQGDARVMCAVGAVTASGLWFYGIGFGARWLAPVLIKPKIWRLIDLIMGCLMVSLALGFLKDGWVLAHAS